MPDHDLTSPNSETAFSFYESTNPEGNELILQGKDNEPLVTINTKTGAFELASGVHPKEAAVEFFTWVERYVKNHHCEEIHDPPADGLEAEELRSGIENLIAQADGDVVKVDDLQGLLDHVDARDSLQVVTTIANLRKALEEKDDCSD